ncbi:nucleotide-binding protein [uncultured Tenacibaculum sp.]|uniref:nucleotide-binding protein n=1 Tax=uncultured Tenacibaculum sp. TaxID=174713 RepID=UPI00263729ED|nr:nucleotide-binding protein [uncultured Tenacibaculum sp.]
MRVKHKDGEKNNSNPSMTLSHWQKEYYPNKKYLNYEFYDVEEIYDLYSIDQSNGNLTYIMSDFAHTIFPKVRKNPSEFVYKEHDPKYLDKYLMPKRMDSENNMDINSTINGLIEKAEKYRKISDEGDFMTGEVNSSQNIALYIDWFLESRELFSEHFDETELAYQNFCKFDTSGNGFTLSSKFSETYALFKILIKKIKNRKVKDIVIKEKKIMKNKIFIVHGHNNELKLEVARFVETDYKKEAVILHEQPSKGREILGKFEDEAVVDLAIAIWSKDDLGQLNKDGEKLKPRARQNVIFETGYFIGKLGRDKVIVILEDGIETPSDYSGIMYISSSDWKYKLGKEITEIYK